MSKSETHKGSYHIDVVKSYEGGEQPDVGLCELVACDVPLPAEDVLRLVQSFEHLTAVHALSAYTSDGVAPCWSTPAMEMPHCFRWQSQDESVQC